MFNEKYSRLIKQGFLSESELLDIMAESTATGKYSEDLLLSKGIPKHEILFCLTEYYGYPFIEYDEDTMVSSKILRMMDLERMKKVLWIPLLFQQ